MIPFLSLKEVTALHGAEINEAVSRVVNGGWYLQGKENEQFEKDYSEVGKRQSELIERFVDDKISVDVIAHELIEEQDRALAAEAEERSSQRDGEYEPVRGEAARYLELANEEKAARGLRGVPEAAFGSEGIRQVMLVTQAAYRAMDQPTRMPELDRTFKTEEIEPERQV